VPVAPRRWLVVAALFVVTFGIATPLAAYGVFLPVLADVFGWSRGAISAALSLNLVVGGVAGFGIGALADRHGPRLLLVVTVAMAGAGFALVSVVRALWQLYLVVGIVAGIGMAGFYLLSTATVSRWFDDRRGLALALVLVGFNIGYITAGPLAASLIAALGWRWAYALIGAGSGLAMVLAALTVRSPGPAEAPRGRAGRAGEGAATMLERGATLRGALADPRLWCLNVSWLMLGGLALMTSVHAVPLARDRGLRLADASLALTAYGVGAVAGRLGSGVVADRLGTRVTMRAAFVIELLALVGLQWLPSEAAMFVAMGAFGIGFAASDTIVVKVIPDIFGLRALGAISGVLTIGWRFGAATGPAAAGFLHDLTGAYTLAFGAAPVGVLVAWALFALGTRGSPRG
jgi:MFS family permease